jgi:hypothetical protein
MGLLIHRTRMCVVILDFPHKPLELVIGLWRRLFPCKVCYVSDSMSKRKEVTKRKFASTYYAPINRPLRHKYKYIETLLRQEVRSFGYDLHVTEVILCVPARWINFNSKDHCDNPTGHRPDSRPQAHSTEEKGGACSIWNNGHRVTESLRSWISFVVLSELRGHNLLRKRPRTQNWPATCGQEKVRTNTWNSVCPSSTLCTLAYRT